MSELYEMREKDLMDDGVLYKAYKDYQYLHNYLKNNRQQHPVSNEQIKDRIQYLLKNKVKQRDEISTLCWVIGEEDERKTKY